MAKREPMPSYVSLVASEFVEVQAQSDETAAALRRLGFVQSGRGRRRGKMQIAMPAPDHEEKAELFNALISLGVAFSAGKDWCPIAVAMHYRNQGLLEGPLRKIGWSGPRHWQVTEV